MPLQEPTAARRGRLLPCRADSGERRRITRARLEPLSAKSHSRRKPRRRAMWAPTISVNVPQTDEGLSAQGKEERKTQPQPRTDMHTVVRHNGALS
ncbi:hypothetical protein AOLI_G00142730 [Acnodon oligacanthus]